MSGSIPNEHLRAVISSLRISEEAKAALEKRLNDTDKEHRLAVLSAIGDAAPETLTHLKAIWTDSDVHAIHFWRAPPLWHGATQVSLRRTIKDRFDLSAARDTWGEPKKPRSPQTPYIYRIRLSETELRAQVRLYREKPVTYEGHRDRVPESFEVGLRVDIAAAAGESPRSSRARTTRGPP